MNAPAISIIAAILLAAAPLLAAEPDANEVAAAKLLATTVTVRAMPTKSTRGAVARSAPVARRVVEPKSAGANQSGANPADARPEEATSQSSGDGVTVCSGISVGPGLIVTFGLATREQGADGARFKVTLPDGQQAQAELRVVDRYSGLNLLEIDHKELPSLEAATGVPAVGSAILTAAAAGIERPVVSLGIVSGVDRSLGGSGLPPLIQCDVRTTETSSGAAVVDRASKLVGVIAATVPSDDGQRGGWTYAVPVRHVARLLEARAVDKLVVLERRRPTIGLTMGAGAKEGTVEVEHVEPGGPADKAGIKKGDAVLEAEGRKIRSAYQAVELIRNRQPGERFPLVIEQAGERRSLEVTLGGASGPAPDGAGDPAQGAYAQQVRVVRNYENNQLEIRNRAALNDANVNIDADRRGGTDDVGQLKAQLQAEIRRREEQQTKNDELIKSLRSEVDALRKALDAKR